MQKPIKALTNFSKYADPKLALTGKTILQSMTGNANFTNPTPSLAALQKTSNNFGAAMLDAANFDRNKIAIKNQYRLQLIEFIRQLGYYVNMVSMGDVPTLTSSGFPLSKVPERIHITAPKHLTILQGLNPGSLICKIPAVKGAKGYFYEISADHFTNNANWLSIPNGRTSYQFNNLLQGQKYWFRVAAVGTHNQLLYSTIVFQYVIQRSMDMAA